MNASSEDNLKNNSPGKSNPSSPKGGELNRLISKHNLRVQHMWWLCIIITITTVAYLITTGFIKEKSYDSFYSQEYNKCRLEEKLRASSSRKQVFLSYVNDSLDKRIILQSNDSARTFEKVGSMPYQDTLAFLELSPDRTTLIVAECWRTVYVKTKGSTDFKAVTSSITGKYYVTGICFKPGTTLAYLYGKSNSVLELNYESGATAEISSSGQYIVQSMEINPRGKIGAVLMDLISGIALPVEAETVPGIFAEFEMRLNARIQKPQVKR